MTFFPRYLIDFPNKDSNLPLHLSVNRIQKSFESHRHDFLEFSYVLSGTGTESINGIVHDMEPGTFTFVLPFQFHEIHANSGTPLVLVNCMFGVNIFMEIGMRELLDEAGQLLSPFARFTGEEEVRMRQKLNELIEEYNGDKPWRLTMLKSGLAETLIRFDRLRRRRSKEQKDNNKPLLIHSSKDKQMTSVIHYIHTHYREPLALGELAAHFRLSPSRFSEWFKHVTGQTFLHYLHDVRLRHGCALLAASELTITEIALEIGYGSYKTFTRIFRDKKGMTPGEYRSRQQAMSTADIAQYRG